MKFREIYARTFRYKLKYLLLPAAADVGATDVFGRRYLSRAGISNEKRGRRLTETSEIGPGKRTRKHVCQEHSDEQNKRETKRTRKKNSQQSWRKNCEKNDCKRKKTIRIESRFSWVKYNEHIGHPRHVWKLCRCSAPRRSATHACRSNTTVARKLVFFSPPELTRLIRIVFVNATEQSTFRLRPRKNITFSSQSQWR